MRIPGLSFFASNIKYKASINSFMFTQENLLIEIYSRWSWEATAGSFYVQWLPLLLHRSVTVHRLLTTTPTSVHWVTWPGSSITVARLTGRREWLVGTVSIAAVHVITCSWSTLTIVIVQRRVTAGLYSAVSVRRRAGGVQWIVASVQNVWNKQLITPKIDKQTRFSLLIVNLFLSCGCMLLFAWSKFD